MEFKFGFHHPKASEIECKTTLNKSKLSPISWYSYYGPLQSYPYCQIDCVEHWVFWLFFFNFKTPHLSSKYETTLCQTFMGFQHITCWAFSGFADFSGNQQCLVLGQLQAQDIKWALTRPLKSWIIKGLLSPHFWR